LKKIITAFILIFVMIISSGQVLAWNNDSELIETDYDSEILLSLISRVAPTLTVSNATATYSLSVTCISSVNNIHATLQIQQWNNGKWNDFGSSWTATSTTSQLNTSGTRPVAGGNTYRLKVTVFASNSSSTDSVTAYSG